MRSARRRRRGSGRPTRRHSTVKVGGPAVTVMGGEIVTVSGGTRPRVSGSAYARIISPQQPATLLIVDDIPMNVRLLKNNLEADGYWTISAYSGAEALKKVADEKPDLVLLDVMMPGMDGFPVCHRIKTHQKQPSCRWCW